MRASTVTACLAFIPSTLCQMVQVVAAGANGLSFSPSSLTAPVGSKVEFQFYAYNHSVASSSFESPCQPDGRIFSGYMPVSSGMGPEVFTITITDTSPIWYYCTQNLYTHCQAGMVGVINPPTSGSQNLTAYAAASARTPRGSSGDLPNIVGGEVEPVSQAPPASSGSVPQGSSSVTQSWTSSAGVITSTVTERSCPSAGHAMKERL